MFKEEDIRVGAFALPEAKGRGRAFRMREFDWLLKEKYQGKFDKRIIKDMRQILGGEPIDYVIGFSDFLGCKIDLSYRPLIPRFETEFWVEKAINEIVCDSHGRVRIAGVRAKRVRRRAIRMLDLFAGSGCIGIAILKRVENSIVHFGELNEKFLKQIRKNLKLNKIDFKRVKLIKTNIFQNIKSRYDYIFANPPYIARLKSDKIYSHTKIQPAVLKYEPKKAIFGGRDGLFYIRKLINKGKKYLKIGGRIYFEFSPEQKNKIERLLKQNNWHYQFFKDQYNMWRYLKIIKN
jgi:release factor glutamine methyltransferase